MDKAIVLLQEAEREIKIDGRPTVNMAASLVNAAQVALQDATEVSEVKDIRDKLDGIGTYLERQKVEQVQSNLVTAQRMRTERVLGVMIPEKFPQGKHSPLTLKGEEISYFQSHRWQRAASIDEQDFEIYVQDQISKNEELTTSGLLNYFAMISDDSYEWYTPAKYIAAAREVLGGIDLDPASCQEANKVVKAGKYYTIEDDGLRHDWIGRVFLNPPYEVPTVAHFTAKLAREYESGFVDCGICLVNNATDAIWFHKLLGYPVCFPVGRVKFTKPGGEAGGPRQGQAFFYLGEDVEKFSKVFSAFGVVLKRV